MAKVRVKQGSEGPAHDPYAYTEITFTKTNGMVYRYKTSGLGSETFWGPRGRKIQSFDRPKHRKPDLAARNAFIKATGMTPEKAERIPDILTGRRTRHMTAKERWQYWECVAADEAMLRNAY